jgi:hypothetical protein
MHLSLSNLGRFHLKIRISGNLDFKIDYNLTCFILLFDCMPIINYQLQILLTDLQLSLIRQLKS